jgi:hypothetical protein
MILSNYPDFEASLISALDLGSCVLLLIWTNHNISLASCIR